MENLGNLFSTLYGGSTEKKMPTSAKEVIDYYYRLHGDTMPLLEQLWKEMPDEIVDFVKHNLSVDRLVDLFEEMFGGQFRWLSEKEMYE